MRGTYYARHGYVSCITAFLLAVCWIPSSEAQSCLPHNALNEPLETAPPSFTWQGHFQETPVCLDSPRGPLSGVLIRPADQSIQTRIGIVIGPGSGSGEEHHYRWAGRDLAGHGYFALMVEPSRQDTQSPNDCEECVSLPQQNINNYMEAMRAGADFFSQSQHPWLNNQPINILGFAGHSLSARAASYLQGEDTRVSALVAWDNLSSQLHGDAGSPSGGGDAGSAISGNPGAGYNPAVSPRVPAMGQASDFRPSNDPASNDPEVKKTAYEFWRAAGIDTMQLVMRNADHLHWVQRSDADPEQASRRLQALAWYTRAWFDWHLRNQDQARQQLLSSQPANRPLGDLLSSNFNSALYLPEQGIDCANLLSGCDGHINTNTRDLDIQNDAGRGGAWPVPFLLFLLYRPWRKRHSRIAIAA